MSTKPQFLVLAVVCGAVFSLALIADARYLAQNQPEERNRHMNSEGNTLTTTTTDWRSVLEIQEDGRILRINTGQGIVEVDMTKLADCDDAEINRLEHFLSLTCRACWSPEVLEIMVERLISPKLRVNRGR
jgi:hypothetical protein